MGIRKYIQKPVSQGICFRASAKFFMKSNPFSKSVPSSEIQNRIHALKTRMEKAGTDAVFLTHKPDIYYFPARPRMPICMCRWIMIHCCL